MSKKPTNIVRRAIEIIQKEGMRIFFKKALSYLTHQPLVLPYALLRIKSLNKKKLKFNNLVNFCFCDIRGLIMPAQVQGEILELLRILDKMKPKVVLEIGTAGGGTLFLFSRIASDDTTIISIDLPGGKFGGGYPKWKIPLYKSFARKNSKIHLIRADSHNQETLEKVKNILNDKKIDFLFIDGDHSYQGVKKDFEMYDSLVRKGGIIAFHDICFHPPETGCEVHSFWNEIRENFTYHEIVKDLNQGWGGIGVIYK